MRTAVEIFAERLATQTDVSDVRSAPDGSFVLVDTRSRQAWDLGHIPGAVHLPTAEIPARAAEVVGLGRTVVTYCWGPGCNGATRAALAFARLGYEVREMIGGVEYWIREGFPVRTSTGDLSRTPDPLTGPVPHPEPTRGAEPARDPEPARGAEPASGDSPAAMSAGSGGPAPTPAACGC